MYDDYDEFNDELDFYDDILDDLEEQNEMIEEMYQEKIDEIDEYWDRENEYIRNSGIYTDEEVRSILEEHERIRKSKKEDAKDNYVFEKECLKVEREDAVFQRSMAVENLEIERMLNEEVDSEPVETDYTYYAPQERPSLLKRLMAFGGAYIIFRNLFHNK